MSTFNPLPPITERTFSVVSDLMDREGLQDRDPHTISLFVEQLVARERFFRTVDGIRERFSDIDPNELDRMIAEETEADRVQRLKQEPGADRS